MNLIGIAQQPIALVAGAGTVHGDAATVTTQALTTAALATATFTIQNNQVNPAGGFGSIVMASLANGTNSAGDAVLQSVTPGAGVITIVVVNTHATNALNGTLKISFVVFN